MIALAILGVVFGGAIVGPAIAIALIVWGWQAVARRALDPTPRREP
jgi:hypothetical protein